VARGRTTHVLDVPPGMAHRYHFGVPSGGYHLSCSRGFSVGAPPSGVIEVTRLAIDEQHIALPQLRGQPAYARPPRLVAETPRPLDPDDLPIVAMMTDEERIIAETLPARQYVGTSSSGHGPQKGKADGLLRPRNLLLRSLAGKLTRSNS
jgi:hypothetical protein